MVCPLEVGGSGASWVLCVNRAARNGGHTCCTYLLCSRAPSIVLSIFTYKHKFKDKVITGFKMASRALSQAQGPSECGVLWDVTGWMPMKMALSFFEPYLHANHSSVLTIVLSPSLLCPHKTKVIGAELFLLLSAWCSNQGPEHHSASSLSLKVHIPPPVPSIQLKAPLESLYFPSP